MAFLQLKPSACCQVRCRRTKSCRIL